jgi:hypothetical protein
MHFHLLGIHVLLSVSFVVGPSSSSAGVLSFFGGHIVLPRLSWSGAIALGSAFSLTLQQATASPTSTLTTTGGTLILQNAVVSGAILTTGSAALDFRNVSLSSTASVDAISGSGGATPALSITLSGGSVIPNGVSLPLTTSISTFSLLAIFCAVS